MARKLPDYDLVANQATEVDLKWPIRYIAYFHYFNPNGLIAKLHDAQQAVNSTVDELDLPNGAILAYGSLNHYSYDQLSKAVGKSCKYTTWIQLKVILNSIQRDIDKAWKFVEEQRNGRR